MIIKLVSLGLILTPFLVFTGMDLRAPKMALAVGIAVALNLLALYQGKIGKLKNPWVHAFIGYLFLSYLVLPKPIILLFNVDVANFWVWQPMLYIVLFALMVSVIANIRFTKQTICTLLKCMVWPAFIMAFYCFFQAVGVEQFFGIKDANPTMARVGGTMGHPTVVASFMAMIVPIAIFLKQYIKAVIIAIAVFVTQSQVACGALVISLLFLFSTLGRRQLVMGIVLICTIFLSLGLILHYQKGSNSFINDSGRFVQWKQIINDVNQPLKEGKTARYSLTGLGMGSFYYSYHVRHNNGFYQAHNDYLELLYNTGYIGLIIFLCMIGWMVKDNFSFKDIWQGRTNRYRMCLLASFICIAINAGGLFVWQIGTTIYYSIVIIGLLHNDFTLRNDI